VRWLLDEMLPRATAEELEQLGHDAVSVADADLSGVGDDVVFDFAVAEQRIVVTENFADFATLLEQRQRQDEPCVPVVFVRKAAFPARRALPSHLAKHLDRWAEQNPEPYEGFHWP
jgi:predicted nuclease of predicted toxin-antitoxin system